MHPSLLLFPLAAIFDLSTNLVGLLFMLVVMTAGAVISVSALYFTHQRRKLWHDTARIALEKGQPLPPQAPSEEDPPMVMKAASENQFTKCGNRKQPRWQRDLRGGLIMLAIGAGIYLALSSSRRIEPPALIAAYVPGFIGVALVLNALISAVFSPKESDAGSLPPPRDAS